MQLDPFSFESLTGKEWIVTNGIGGYASGTVSGINTRRYHGVLVASFDPPVSRKVIISKVEETVIVHDQEHAISANRYHDAIHPKGFHHLHAFERMPLPEWIYKGPNWQIRKTIFMPHGSNTVVLEYENMSGTEIRLKAVPLFVCREDHHLRQQTSDFDITIQDRTGSKIWLRVDAMSELVGIDFPGGNFSQDSYWHKGFQYEQERIRGLDCYEDALCIGEILFELHPGEKAHLIFTTEHVLIDPAEEKAIELNRLTALEPAIPDKFVRDLIISGDQFLVSRESTKGFSLIAGYHWFTDWGRDTMIAMRGLIIATGKKEVAESIFRTFLQHMSDGLIPNRFPDRGEEPEYNTIDATLWLFVAIYEYYIKFSDDDFILEIFPALTEIIESYSKGTKFNIRVTEDHLVTGGNEHTQLTWMDAKVGDHVVTPRQGYAVEINALWYNALNIYRLFCRMTGNNQERWEQEITDTRQAFRKFFLNRKGYLNDVVDPAHRIDDSFRSNQIYAISLPFSPLTMDECRSILSIVEEKLYTDLGLRTLAPDDPDFQPFYEGDQWQRDHAYHQGTVWPFLWGEYALAHLKVHGYSKLAKVEIRKKARRLEQHFYSEAGLYAMSEIFDGGQPEAGKGCIQQAWSAGMTIKALLETIDQPTNP